MALLIVAGVTALSVAPFIALGVGISKGYPALGYLLGLLGVAGLVLAVLLPRKAPLKGAGRGKHKAPVRASVLTSTGRLGRHRPWPRMAHRPQHRRAHSATPPCPVSPRKL